MGAAFSARLPCLPAAHPTPLLLQVVEKMKEVLEYYKSGAYKSEM